MRDDALQPLEIADALGEKETSTAAEASLVSVIPAGKASRRRAGSEDAARRVADVVCAAKESASMLQRTASGQ